MTRRIWYVSYGSNLLRARFITYLTGGPIPGATDGRNQAGARDPALPTADLPVEINHTLVFAKRSARWGHGGVAFLDPDEQPATPTLGRAWNITARQLEDVFRQENQQPESVDIDVDELVEHGHFDGYSSSYGRLLYLGRGLDDLPLITLTGSKRPTEPNPAHHSYLAVMAEGLAECWSLDRTAADRYLATLPQPPRRLMAEPEA